MIMNRKRMLYLLALALIVSFSVIRASDQSSTSDGSPVLDDQANACDKGGSLDGQCDSDLLREAGWYLIRFEHGLTPEVGFPTRLIWALPSDIQARVIKALGLFTVDDSCYIQVGITKYEFASPAVLSGENQGDFYWSAGRLMNDYSGWRIWDNNIWSVGYYGDCSSLGTADPAPEDLDIVFVNPLPANL